MATKKSKTDAGLLNRWKRVLRFDNRISMAELQMIEELCEKRKQLGLNKTSRMDVIMLCVRFARGEMVSLDKEFI